MDIFMILIGLIVFAIGCVSCYTMYKELNDKDNFWVYAAVCLVIIGILVGICFLNINILIMILFIALCLILVPKIRHNRVIVKLLCIIVIIGVFSIMTAASGLMIYDGLTDGNFGSEKTANSIGYEIKNYEVILDVGLDNKVDVTENISTYFYGSNKHGIYKFTPEWLEYTGKDGKTIKRKSKVLDYRAIGDNYTIDIVSKKPRIKIGDADQTISGEKNYTIKYTYDMGADPFDNFDEFIFHAFGDYWDTTIRNPKIVINMPKGIDGNTINVFMDKYRNKNAREYLNIDVSANTVTISLKDNRYVLDGALTVDIELPDNYFVGGSYNYGWISFIISMVIIGATGYVIYLWSKYGKDKEKRVPTVEFYAPDDLSSAEIGYLFNRKRITRKLTISLLVQLASKGYIKIDEVKDKKTKESKIIITDLRKVHGRKVSGLSDCEAAVYNNLFKSKSEIILNEHTSFYKAFDEVNSILKTKFNKKIYDANTKKPRIITLCIIVAIVFLSSLSFFVIEDMDPKWSILYYVSFASIAVNLFFIIIMGRKTDYGEVISAKVKGFREFLETAEKEKLEALVLKNPNYFYDILPYTYVLNISKKWIKKFEKIPYKKADMGHFDYLDGDTLFTSIGNCIHYPNLATSSGRNSGSNGGCSSCGGGCSSCGGGCSSCGGGGSW